MSQFIKYIAVTSFSVGLPSAKNEEQHVIEEGDPVEFNGKIARIYGEEHFLPRLKSAISARWLLEESALTGGHTHVPVSAHIKMSAATPQQEDVIASTTITEEERNVGSLSEVRARGRYEGPEIEAQDGRVVSAGGFQTAAYTMDDGGTRAATNVMTVRNTSSAGIESKAAEEKRQRLEQLEREKMARKIAQLQEQLGTVAPQAPVKSASELEYERRIAELEAELAGRSRPQMREGIQFQTEGISQNAAQTSDDFDVDSPEFWDGGEGSEVVATLPKTDVELVEPAVSAADVVENKDARLAVARQMFPKFDWDFKAHWRSKLKRLKDQDSPMFVMAAYAVESDSMKQQIAKSFPQYNLGA